MAGKPADNEISLGCYRTRNLRMAGKPADSPSTCQRGPPKQYLGLKTVAAFFGYLSMGSALSILGPTLLSMQVLHDTDTAGISWAFTAMRTGGLLGAALCGVFLERINPEFQLGSACCLAGVTMAIAPFTGRLVGFLLLFIFIGTSIGFLDSGSIPHLIKLWERSSSRDTVLHTMSVFCSAGRFITPLLIRDLLYIEKDDISGDVSECLMGGGRENDTFFIKHTQAFVTPQNTSLSKELRFSAVNYSLDYYANTAVNVYNSTSSSFEPISQNVTELSQVAQSRYAYVVIGCIPLIGAVLYTVSFLVNKGFHSFCNKVKDKQTNTDSVSALSETLSTGRRAAFYLLCCIYMFNFNWLENHPGGFLAAFAVRGLCMDVKTGSVLTSVYWGCHGVGRLLTVLLSRWLIPRRILVILLSTYSFGILCALFIPLHHRLVWVTAVLAGIGSSSMYFTSLLWFSAYIRVTGRISAMCIIAISIGGMVGPIFVANMFQAYGYMWLIYIQIGSVLCQSSLVCLIEGLAKIFKINRPCEVALEKDIAVEEITRLQESNG